MSCEVSQEGNPSGKEVEKLPRLLKLLSLNCLKGF